MSSDTSESDTLLPSSPADGNLDDTEKRRLIDRPDLPTQFDQFLRNVAVCKGLLGLALPAATGMEIAHLVVGMGAARPEGVPWGQEERDVVMRETIADAIGVALTAIVTLVYLVTLFKPIKPPTPTSSVRNINLHRYLCGILFAFLLTCLVIHPLPAVVYTVITKLSPPIRTAPGPVSLYILGNARTITLVVALFIGGNMRRGPHLHYERMRMATGFGLNVEDVQVKKSIKSGPEQDDAEALIGPEEQESNVLDWSNCSMLAFVSLFYVWPLVKRSTVADQLARSDLPYLEQYVRQAGFTQMNWDAEKDGEVKLDDSPDGLDSTRRRVAPIKTYTHWALLKATWSGRGKVVLSSLALDAIKTGCGYIQIASMYEIINTFDQPAGSDKSYARLMCWGLFFGQTVEVLLGAYLWVRENYLLHLPSRMTLASILFSKILRTADAQAKETHHASDADRSTGEGRSQVMNLLTIDTNTIASLATIAPSVSNSIISLTIGIGFLYRMLGISAFVGIACIPLSAPLSTYVAKNIYRCDKAWARHRDARVAAIKEFLLGVKVIKLNAFEDYSRQNIQRLRDVEVVWQRWRYTLGTLFNILADQLPIFAMLITFFFHTKILHRRLEPATAFVALGVFNRVKDSLSVVPNAVNELLMTKVALGRLCTYLNQAEIADTTWDTTSSVIRFKAAVIGWPKAGDDAEGDESGRTFRLRDLNLTLPEEKFTLVCGPLGCGKTLFLRALLGEATVEEGSVQSPRSAQDSVPIDGASIHGTWTNETWLTNSVAYAPQQSYIQHGTIRDNILFGQPMWRERYREVLRQASLLSDLKLMPDSDMTEVGAKGANLSGGQKARVNLARCLYSRARTVYMDDILSAVDAHTSHFIVKECLAGDLFKGRTVVLVTHHVGLCLPVVDFVVSLREGNVEQSGPPSDVDLHVIAAQLPPTEDEEEEMPEPVSDNFRETETEQVDRQKARQIYKTEQMGMGRLAKRHYLFVLTSAGGLGYWLLLTFVYGGARAFDVGRIVWLRRWSADTDPEDVNLNLSVYALLVTTAVLAGALRWVILYGVGNVGFYNRGSRLMHKRLLDKICAAPLSFFETTPSGRIMNIFGQDMNALDGSSADAFGRTVSSTLDVATSAFIVCLQAPFMIIFMLVFALPFYYLSKILRKLRADLRRLGATAASPLISLYNDTIEGVVMVRAFGSGSLMCATMVAFINRERQTTLADYTIFNWVRAVIQSVTSIIVTATGFYLIKQDITSAQAGFILSFAVTTSSGLYGLLQIYSDLERVFVSAERVNQYVEMPVTESTEGKTPPPDWPSKGAVSFKKLCVTYAPDLPDVLHNVSLDIEPGMRVGVVGATGSGKSTLALSLFRAMESRDGCIEIDGDDIKGIKLKELRKRLNMVVQDGSLNSGTLRDALDITQASDDFEVYEALRRVHLLPESLDEAELKENPFANLDTFVAVEGANFSHGQRQLLCLARALLKKSKILVMDEATSSVDFDMDAKITATIKECFADTTIIVIAHRLATIMHYDRVLVLDRGKVLEYDEPRKLMEDGGSAFRALCMVQGKEEFEKLFSMTGAVIEEKA